MNAIENSQTVIFVLIKTATESRKIKYASAFTEVGAGNANFGTLIYHISHILLFPIFLTEKPH